MKGTRPRPVPLALAAALFLALAACASAPEVPGGARLERHDARIPFLWARSIMILAIDGRPFGPAYRSIPITPGYHEAHVVWMDCPLPVLVVPCLESAGEKRVPFVAEAGQTYVPRLAMTGAGPTVWIEAEHVADLRAGRVREERSGSEGASAGGQSP